jgi:ABC-2 type transport system permease protein
LFLYLIPKGWWHLAVVLLFFQMLALQLFTLFTQYKWNVSFVIYPIKPSVKINAFTNWLRQILFLQGAVYGIFYGVLTGDWLIALLMPAAAVLYSMLRLPALAKKHG